MEPALGDRIIHRYQATALLGTNKTGKLKKDADGYYTMVVGAVGVLNSGGAFYNIQPARDLFDKSSTFMRRIQNACLKGEVGHPVKLPGMSQRDFMMRALRIEDTNVSHHFSDIWLEEGGKVRDKSGNPVIAIMAKVKPAGIHGPALEAALNNPKEEVCFSIRALTDDYHDQSGRLNKNLKECITFDWVVEPGISVATKYSNPALEELAPAMDFTVNDMYEVLNISKQPGLGFESTGVIQIANSFIAGARTIARGAPRSLSW